jgi:hypothetical protein
LKGRPVFPANHPRAAHVRFVKQIFPEALTIAIAHRDSRQHGGARRGRRGGPNFLALIVVHLKQ